MEFKDIFDDLPEGFRVATPDDLPLITLTFAQAFADYEYPMPSTKIPYNARLKNFYNLFDIMVKNGIKEGVVFTNEDFSAVMVTVPVDKMAPIPAEEMSKLLSNDATPADGENFLKEYQRVDELESTMSFDPNTIYIECFAVQTPRQGQKLGSKLMRQLFKQCKAHNRDILLYTNTDRNRAIYEHFGYKCIKEDYCDEINFNTFFMLYKQSEHEND